MAPIFGSNEQKLPPAPPAPISWVRNRNGNFSKLVTLNTTKSGVVGGGVFVIWHSGVKPHWVTVGHSDDLAKDIDALRDDPEVLLYDTRGGLFVSWALIKSEYRAGIVKYLNETMEPLVPRGGNEKVAPIPVLAPGTKGDAPGDPTI